jgi:hypothetical protein
MLQKGSKNKGFNNEYQKLKSVYFKKFLRLHGKLGH